MASNIPPVGSSRPSTRRTSVLESRAPLVSSGSSASKTEKPEKMKSSKEGIDSKDNKDSKDSK